MKTFAPRILDVE